MATQVIMQPYFTGNPKSTQQFWGGPEYPHVKETASQSYAIGDLIYYDTNGTIAIATVDGGTPTLLTSVVAGQALKAATGTTGANVYFRQIKTGDLFIVNVHHETPASAVTTLTDLCDIRGLCRSSTVPTGQPAGTTWRLSLDAAGESATLANGDMTIVGFPLKSPIGGVAAAIGDIYGLVLAQFNAWSQSTDAGSDPAPRRILQLPS